MPVVRELTDFTGFFTENTMLLRGDFASVLVDFDFAAVIACGAEMRTMLPEMRPRGNEKVAERPRAKLFPLLKLDDLLPQVDKTFDAKEIRT
jgi:hypothetical protein